jgi:hypothetical protein
MVTRVSQRVFLHVGLPKSGTTYIQAVLGKNKRQLKQRAGLLYPGRSWNDQVDAVKDLRRMKLSPERMADVTGAWDRVVAEMRSWPGDSLFSMEWLCTSAPGRIRRIVKDLAFAEVHVVFTARDVGRTVPAAWQEFCQNRSTWRWPDFLDQVTGDDPRSTPAGKAFWGEQDMELLLDRWTAAVPAGRTHVVTVPQSGSDPEELWRRVARVVGIEPQGYDLSDLGSNASLGMESAELMRRLNVRLDEQGVALPTYNRVFKHKVAKKILSARKGQESKVLLPVEYHDWARDRADQQIEAIRSSGAEVVGDLDDLRPVLDTTGKAQTVATEPEPEAVLDAAVEAFVTVALEPSNGARRRNGRQEKKGTAPAAAREGLMRRIRLDLVDRVRGRSSKEIVLAARRRLRRAGAGH